MTTLKDSWKELNRLENIMHGIIIRFAEIAVFMARASGVFDRHDPHVRQLRLFDVTQRRQFFYAKRQYFAYRKIFEKEISNV